MKCKNLVINICIIVVMVAIIIVGFMIFFKYYNNHKNEEDIAQFIEENYNENYTTNNSNYSSDKNLNLQYKGYNVLGVIKIPKVNNIIQSLLTIIPLQLIAYEVAKLNKCDIDKPRNLAKSVTVE